LRKAALIVFFLGMLLLLASAAQAQAQFDAAFGVSGLKGTSAVDASGNFFPQDVGGGVFPTFSGDFLLFKHVGLGGRFPGEQRAIFLRDSFPSVPSSTTLTRSLPHLLASVPLRS